MDRLSPLGTISCLAAHQSWLTLSNIAPYSQSKKSTQAKAGEAPADTGSAAEQAPARVIVLHGLCSNAVMAFGRAYGHRTDLPQAILSSSSPRNEHRKLGSLMDEWAHDCSVATDRHRSLF